MRMSVVAALLLCSSVVAAADRSDVRLGASVIFDGNSVEASTLLASKSDRYRGYVALAKFGGLNEKTARFLLTKKATNLLALAAGDVLLNIGNEADWQAPSTPSLLIPALARHAISREVGQTREDLTLAAQYFLMFAPPTQAEQVFTHIVALAHELTRNYQHYTQVLLAPVMNRYYAWLPHANDARSRQQLGMEYSALNLQEGTAIMNRVEQGTLIADKLPLGVHAAYGRELDDLRFLAIAAAQRVALETELGPSLLMFSVNCKSRNYDDAQAVLAALETELAPSLSAYLPPKKNSVLSRAARLLPPLLGELREVARRMKQADRLIEFFDLPGTSQSSFASRLP